MAGPFVPPTFLLGRPGGAVTTGTGPWLALGGGPTLLNITTTGTGTITAGTMLIEETDDPSDPTGAAPAQVSTLDCTTLTGGKKNVAHVGPGCYLYVRARLSVNVAGGSIVVALAGA